MGKKEKIGTYRAYIRKRTLGYSIGIIVAMHVVFILFLACSILVGSIWGTQRKAQRLSDEIELVLASLHSGMQQAAMDPALLAAVQGDGAAAYESNVLLYAMANEQSVLPNFSLLNLQGDIISSNLYEENRLKLLESPALAELLEEAPGLSGGAQPDYRIVLYGYNYEQEATLSLVQPVLDADGTACGILLCDLRDVSLYGITQEESLDQTILTDRFDMMLFSTYRPMLDPMEKYPMNRLQLEWTGTRTALLDGRAFHVACKSLEQGQFKLYAFTSSSFQHQLFLYGGMILFAICLLTIMLVYFLMSNTLNRTSRSIERLVEAADRIGGGDLNYQIVSQEFDEFQSLNDAFNILTENLRIMIARNEELAEHKRALELKQMENQFNPHFVFNTLETIRYKTMLDPPVAGDMVFRLAKLMRYTMNFGNNKVPLRTDVLFLEDYLSLQKMRFGNRLHYSIDVAPELLNMRFPKLLLQPVVENCFSHSIEKKKELSVSISGQRRGAYVELSVRDNGDGISPQRMKQLQAQLQQEWSSGKHFGLYSVHRTIQLVYGEQYGLSVESEPGEGTQVFLSLPAEEEEEDVSGIDC